MISAGLFDKDWIANKRNCDPNEILISHLKRHTVLQFIETCSSLDFTLFAFLQQ